MNSISFDFAAFKELFKRNFGNPNNPNYLDRMAADERVVIVMNRVGEEFVGFAMGFKLDEQTFHLEAIAVDNVHRRKGHGRALLERIETVAAEKFGSTQFALQVQADNSGAQSLYSKSGYHQQTSLGPMYLFSKGFENFEVGRFFPAFLEIQTSLHVSKV